MNFRTMVGDVWILGVAILLCACTVQSIAETDVLAEHRAQHLRHGINTSIWFAQSPDIIQWSGFERLPSQTI
jgi:hypothetical protein